MTTILLLTVAGLALLAAHWPYRPTSDGPAYGPGSSIPLRDRSWSGMGQGNF